MISTSLVIKAKTQTPQRIHCRSRKLSHMSFARIAADKDQLVYHKSRVQCLRSKLTSKYKEWVDTLLVQMTDSHRLLACEMRKSAHQTYPVAETQKALKRMSHSMLSMY